MARRMRRRCGRRLCAAGVAALLVLSLTTRPTAAFENMVSAANEISKDSPKRPVRTAHALHTLYPRTDALLARMRELTARCDAASVGRVQTAGGGGDLEYVTLTRRKGYLGGHLLRRRTRVAFVFGESAREAFVTSQVAMEVLEAVCREEREGEVRAGSGLHATAARVLEFAEIVLVPLVNVAGRKVAEQGGYCEVGNARDVDLNRNFPKSWGLLPATDAVVRDPYPRREAAEAGAEGGGGPSEGVGPSGAAPFSEWETRALRTLITSLRPSAYVSVQSGYGLALSPPGECRHRDGPDAADVLRLNSISDRLVAMHCGKCSHKRLLALSGRSRCGSGADYFFDLLNKPGASGGGMFVYTWRIYANRAATSLDCLRAFNPMTKRVLRSVTDRWGRALFTLTEAVHVWRMEEREHGVGAALLNASREAAAAAARHPVAGAMDVDEEEALAGADALSAPHSAGVAGAGFRGNVGGRPDVSTFTASLVAVAACVLCLLLLRSVVFASRLRPYRSRTRRDIASGSKVL